MKWALPWVVLLIIGCDERVLCATTSDCDEGELCLWVHDEGAMACARVCNDSSQCPGPSTCEQGASSCDVCDDIIRICD